MATSANQVVLLQLRSDWETLKRRLRHLQTAGDSVSFEVNIRERDAVSSAVRRLCLIAEHDKLVAVGLIRSERRSGDLDTLIRVGEAQLLKEAISLERVIEGISHRSANYARTALRGTSVLPEATAAQLLEAIAATSEEASAALDYVRARLLEDRPRQGSVQATTELHDAVTLGLRIAGFESGVLTAWQPGDGASPREHFAGLALMQGTPSEAAMIRHDSTNFGDWTSTPGTRLDAYEFTDPNDSTRRVTVIYADKEAEERATGADLIYFREHYPGYVLVQYKRMREQGGSSRAGSGNRTGQRTDRATETTYGYRPDRQLQEEIRRMRAVLGGVPTADTPSPDASSATADVGTWRLHDQPFYIKLVQEGRARPTQGDLIAGMYFPIDLFELMLGSPGIRGDNLTRPIGWDNVDRYFTNTDFLMLMQNGWIGSTGVATVHIAAILDEVLRSGKGALVVYDHSPPRRRSEARRTRTRR